MGVWENRWELWKSHANEVHGGKYQYPSSDRVPNGKKWKITIVCPVHGEFQQDPLKHHAGQGCPSCRGDKISETRGSGWGQGWEEWKRKAREVHGDKYEYPSSDFEVREGRRFITIICPTHGPFSQDAAKHLIGRGCAKCQGRGTDKVHDLMARFPENDWSHLASIGSKDSVMVKCPRHGDTTSNYNRLMSKREDLPACSKCSKELGGLSNRVGAAMWIERVTTKLPNLTLDGATVTRSQDKCRVVCEKHGEFFARPLDLANGHGCPTCAAGRASRGEEEIADLIKTLGFDVKRSDRTLLSGLELDIVVHSAKVAIEYCGNYWHDERHKANSYHQDKMDKTQEAGYRLITIFEDEWAYTREKVEARIRHALGSVVKVGARRTKVRLIQWSEAAEFLSKYHMADRGTVASASYGMFLGDNLVSVMTFGTHRFSGEGVEIYRFCSVDGISIIGGISKFIHKYLSDHPDVRTIHTYADLRWGTGNGYGAAGFKYAGRTQPGYSWCKGLERHSRQRFQKHKLPLILDNFAEELSEVTNCQANGYWRIFDCGMSRWEYTNG